MLLISKAYAHITLFLIHCLVENHKTMVRSAMQLQGNISKIMFEYNIGKGFRGYSVSTDKM